jgi:hypothetical protein
MMAGFGPCRRPIVSLQELSEGRFFIWSSSSGVSFGRWRMKWTSFQLSLSSAGSPSPQAGIAVKRIPLWITQKISPSDID